LGKILELSAEKSDAPLIHNFNDPTWTMIPDLPRTIDEKIL